MPEKSEMHLVIRLRNTRAVERLGEAMGLVDSAAEDMPWRDDLAEASRLLRKAARSLTPRRLRKTPRRLRKKA